MAVFVPFHNQPVLLNALPLDGQSGWERRDRSTSGSWNCVLRVLTPLSIRNHFKTIDQYNRGREAFLPGSSLRGLLRSTFEYLGASCTRHHGQPPAAHPRCNPAQPCLTCRLFGFQQDQTAWQGKVRISNTDWAAVQWQNFSPPPDPRPPHPAAAQNGWILFPSILPPGLHRPAQAANGNTRFVAAGAEFPFRVDFVNLSPLESALLHYALSLTRPNSQLAHIIGFAKALSFGLCSVSTTAPPPSGYEILGPYFQLPGYRVIEQNRPLPDL